MKNFFAKLIAKPKDASFGAYEPEIPAHLQPACRLKLNSR
jgi:hypothetical protein